MSIYSNSFAGLLSDEYSEEDNYIEEEEKQETNVPTPNPAITSATSENQGEQLEQGSRHGESKKRDNSKKDGQKRDNSKKDGQKRDNSKKDGSKREESKKEGSKKENSKRDGLKREESKKNEHTAAPQRSILGKLTQGMTQSGPARTLLESTTPKCSASVSFGSQGKHNEEKSAKKPQRETRQQERVVTLQAKPQRETKQDPVVPPESEEIQTQGKVLSNDEKTAARRIIALIDGRITNVTPWNQICEKSEIHNITSYFLKEPLSDSDFEQATNCEFELTDVPALLVSFLIEAFAIDQPPEMKYLEEKDYSKLTRVKLNMPVPIPVSLKSNDKDDVCIGFFSTPIMSAKEARDITAIALNNMAIRTMEKVTMTNVDSEYFETKHLDEFVKKTQCRLLYRRETKQNGDEEEEVIRIKVMNQKKYTGTKQQHTPNKADLQNIFNECCLLKCKKCGDLYNEHEKECYKKHTGELIVDVEGNEYDTEVDEETGEVLHLEEWSCCGEVYREYEGCISEDDRTDYPNGEHELDSVVSVFDITTEAIWSNNKK